MEKISFFVFRFLFVRRKNAALSCTICARKSNIFNIWVVKRTVNGTPKTNINFLKPIEEVAPNTEVVDDSQEPVDSQEPANN